MRRMMKNYIKKLLCWVFVTGQRFGISVLPLHYYSSIPNVRRLATRTDWKQARSMTGISMRSTAEQLTFLKEVMSSIGPTNKYDFHAQALIKSKSIEGYGVIESEVLAAFIANQNVTKVVQVGCGVSTAVMLDSAEKQDRHLAIACIEPYPSAYLRRLSQEGRIELFAEIAQLVDMEVFTKLKAGDLLFVDSTHTVIPGSEVNRIILEVLPRLDKDVWVHFHDIYFPYDYSRGFLSSDLFFSEETALLYAFLLQNPMFRIELSMSALHYAAPEQVKLLIPKYDPQHNDEGLKVAGGLHFPSSIFLRRVAQ